jgi:L-glutamine-phosphate cytidylyltransferase
VKVIILSAGFGRRLGKAVPKSLVKITAHQTILDLQLQTLNKNLDLESEDVLVVAGYKNELFRKKYPQLSFAINHHFKNTGTAKSLLIGLKEIDRDDVLWINGDVVFEDSMVQLLRKHLNHNFIVVKNDLTATEDEEFLYTVDENGCIDKISRSLPEGRGFHLGINYLKKENFHTFQEYLEKSSASDYFDVALQSLMDKGVKFIPLDIGENFCQEIDYQKELEVARKFFKTE